MRVARVGRADRCWARGWGVLGRRSLPAGEGLWLPGVASVHTLFVRFPLDLLFLDENFVATRMVSDVMPWRPLVRAPGARHTVELGAKTLAQAIPAARVGDRWRLQPLLRV